MSRGKLWITAYPEKYKKEGKTLFVSKNFVSLLV
jgi:hypothetical protein